ncbi:MAG: hypothetical protein C4334_07490 [Pyrinomonas sp.]
MLSIAFIQSAESFYGGRFIKPPRELKRLGVRRWICARKRGADAVPRKERHRVEEAPVCLK